MSEPQQSEPLAFEQAPPPTEQMKDLLNLQLRGQWSSAQVQQLSPTALAYIGDAVYELFVRVHYLMPPRKPRLYHHQVVAQVRAESQAQQLRSLEPHLTPAERDLLKRGRNAASGCPKRLNPAIYQQATSLETLIGYLYLCDPQRLAYLLTQLNLNAPPESLENLLP